MEREGIRFMVVKDHLTGTVMVVDVLNYEVLYIGDKIETFVDRLHDMLKTVEDEVEKKEIEWMLSDIDTQLKSEKR